MNTYQKYRKMSIYTLEYHSNLEHHRQQQLLGLWRKLGSHTLTHDANMKCFSHQEEEGLVVHWTGTCNSHWPSSLLLGIYPRELKTRMHESVQLYWYHTRNGSLIQWLACRRLRKKDVLSGGVEEQVDMRLHLRKCSQGAGDVTQWYSSYVGLKWPESHALFFRKYCRGRRKDEGEWREEEKEGKKGQREGEKKSWTSTPINRWPTKWSISFPWTIVQA